MLLHFEPVCTGNRKEIEQLQVFPAQAGFIESVEECLQEADQASEWRPVGIYDGSALVGFAMYGCFSAPPPGRLWLDRLLIGKAHQGKGYGKASVLALLEKLHREYGSRQVHLSVYQENAAAIALYRQVGFRFTGEYDTKGEKMMVYTF